MVPIGPLDWVNHCNEVSVRYLIKQMSRKSKIASKPDFWAKFSNFFPITSQWSNIDPKMMTCQIMLPNWYNLGSSWMISKPLVGLLVDPIGQM